MGLGTRLQARYLACSSQQGTPFPTITVEIISSLCVIIAINGTREAQLPQLSLAIWTSAPKMSTEKVIVMILHVVLNRIHVSVTVHFERACSWIVPMAAGLYTRLSASRHVAFHHRCIQSNVVMPRSGPGLYTCRFIPYREARLVAPFQRWRLSIWKPLISVATLKRSFLSCCVHHQ